MLVLTTGLRDILCAVLPSWLVKVRIHNRSVVNSDCGNVLSIVIAYLENRSVLNSGCGRVLSGSLRSF